MTLKQNVGIKHSNAGKDEMLSFLLLILLGVAGFTFVAGFYIGSNQEVTITTAIHVTAYRTTSYIFPNGSAFGGLTMADLSKQLGYCQQLVVYPSPAQIQVPIKCQVGTVWLTYYWNPPLSNSGPGVNGP